jgi:hypothetical protein
MSNVHEREKIMMGGFHGGGMGGLPGGAGGSDKEQEELSELSENTGLSEKELIRLKTTTAQRVFWIVVGSAILLSLIVYNLGAYVFHFW